MGSPKFNALMRGILAGGGGEAYASVIPASLSKWAAAKARGAASPARFAINGDSNLSGEGAGGGALGFDGAALLGMADVMSANLGFRHESIFGDQNVTTATSVATWDTRVTLGSGWAMDAAPSTYGGRFYIAPAASTGTLTFAPSEMWDKAVIWTPRVSTAATALEVYVDGVLNTTINQSGVNGFFSTTVTTTLGTHTIGFKNGTTGQAFITGIEFANSTSATPVALKGGWCAVRFTSLNDNSSPWKNRAALTSIAPDFIVVYCSINDIRDGLAVATYQSQVDNYVLGMRGFADGVLCLGYPPNHANWPTLGEQYATALKTVASSRGWGFYDSRNVFGADNAAAAAKGFRFDDSHPSLSGHVAFGNALAAKLIAWGI